MSRLPTEEARRLSRTNQRATVRYRCAPATAGRLYRAGDQEFQRAWIINLSRNGIGASVTRPLPVGTFLVVQMRGSKGVVEMPVQVIHATRQNQTEWLLGCQLVHPLSDDDLEALL